MVEGTTVARVRAQSQRKALIHSAYSHSWVHEPLIAVSCWYPAAFREDSTPKFGYTMRWVVASLYQRMGNMCAMGEEKRPRIVYTTQLVCI